MVYLFGLAFTVLLVGSLVWWLRLPFRFGRVESDPLSKEDAARPEPGILPHRPGPRGIWHPWATTLGIGMVALHLVQRGLYEFGRFSDVPQHPPPATLRDVQLNCLVAAVMTFLLLWALAAGLRPLAEYGITLKNVLRQVRDGLEAFLAAILPVFIALLATSPLRPEETRHSFLKALESGDTYLVVWIGLGVVLIAPLAEELLYRVVLQGTLRGFLRPFPAIVLTAVTFALVHGLADALPLLPLALILGYVYEQRHSYLTVVVLHGVFNGCMFLAALAQQQMQQELMNEPAKILFLW